MTYEEVQAFEANQWLILLQDSEWVRLFEKRAVLRKKISTYEILGRKAERDAAMMEFVAVGRDEHAIANRILNVRAAG